MFLALGESPVNLDDPRTWIGNVSNEEDVAVLSAQDFLVGGVPDFTELATRLEVDPGSTMFDQKKPFGEALAQISL